MCTREAKHYKPSSEQGYCAAGIFTKASEFHEPKPRYKASVIKKAALSARHKARQLASSCQKFLGLQGTACLSQSGRNFLVDSGASYHLIGRSFLSEDETSRIKLAKRPVTLRTADRPISATEVVEIYVHDLKATFEFYVL